MGGSGVGERKKEAEGEERKKSEEEEAARGTHEHPYMGLARVIVAHCSIPSSILMREEGCGCPELT